MMSSAKGDLPLHSERRLMLETVGYIYIGNLLILPHDQLERRNGFCIVYESSEKHPSSIISQKGISISIYKLCV